jgi:predicted DNA-binding transcriptional regulator AlpA
VKTKLPALTLTEPIPHVCLVRDILRILQISERTFYKLLREGAFPIPEIVPSLNKQHRYAGVDVADYIQRRATSAEAADVVSYSASRATSLRYFDSGNRKRRTKR